MMWTGKSRNTRRTAFGAYRWIAVGIISASLLTGCGGGDDDESNTLVSPTPASSQPPPPSTTEQKITLIATNTGNANVQTGTFPLTGTPNGRFVNDVQVRGDYQFTIAGRALSSTFTLGNSTDTELRVGDTVDLSVFRAAYTQTGPGTSFFSWRSRSGTARITAIYNGSIYVFTLENMIMEPEPSATDNDASGSFTVDGDGYVVVGS
ncbi:MAG: hypothetical protein H8F28_17820 [Fibrella sp.]|nr:hypothetical protein [Armatimonadota bacterium]